MSATNAGTDVLLKEAMSGRGNASREALSGLLSALYPALLDYLVRLTGDRETAQDACQETMVRIVASLPGFRLPSGADATAALKSWAFTMATNVYRDYLRKAAHSTPVAEPEDAARESGGAVATSPAAEDEAEAAIARDNLMQGASRLPEEQRSVFLLKAYYGYSYAEIGRIVGCPEGTAKSRLHHAVLALREDLERRGTL